MRKRPDGLIQRTGASLMALAVLALTATGLVGCTDERDLAAGRLLLVGKVINKETDEWPNNRLVVVFLRGEEVGRAISATGDSHRANLGVVDGLFSVEVDNTYRLTVNELTRESGLQFEVMAKTIGQAVRDYTVRDLFTNNYAYHWFDDVEEGGVYHVNIPSKNLEYVMTIVKGDAAALPPEMQGANSLRLRTDGTIVVELSDESIIDPPADNPIDIPDLSVEPTKNVKELKRISVPINNCGGNEVVSQKYVQAETFVHKYSIGWTGGLGLEIPFPLRLWLLTELESQFGFENGQVESRSIEYTMAAQPHTNVRYTVTWSEVWEGGTSPVGMGAKPIDVPFKVRTDLVYAVDSVLLDCP